MEHSNLVETNSEEEGILGASHTRFGEAPQGLYCMVGGLGVWQGLAGLGLRAHRNV